jgi:hypothetical protein
MSDLSQDLFFKEILSGVGGDRMEGIVYGYAYALLVVTHTEGASELYLIAQSVLCYQGLKLFDDLARTLNVT